MHRHSNHRRYTSKSTHNDLDPRSSESSDVHSNVARRWCRAVYTEYYDFERGKDPSPERRQSLKSDYAERLSNRYKHSRSRRYEDFIFGSDRSENPGQDRGPNCKSDRKEYFDEYPKKYSNQQEKRSFGRNGYYGCQRRDSSSDREERSYRGGRKIFHSQTETVGVQTDLNLNDRRHRLSNRLQQWRVEVEHQSIEAYKRWEQIINLMQLMINKSDHLARDPVFHQSLDKISTIISSVGDIQFRKIKLGKEIAQDFDRLTYGGFDKNADAKVDNLIKKIEEEMRDLRKSETEDWTQFKYQSQRMESGLTSVVVD